MMRWNMKKEISCVGLCDKAQPKTKTLFVPRPLVFFLPVQLLRTNSAGGQAGFIINSSSIHSFICETWIWIIRRESCRRSLPASISTHPPSSHQWRSESTKPSGSFQPHGADPQVRQGVGLPQPLQSLPQVPHRHSQISPLPSRLYL